MKIELAAFNSIGCVIENKDFLLTVDIPIAQAITLTEDQLYGIKCSKRPYVSKVVKLIRLANEINEYYSLIKKDIDTINNKYNTLQFGKIDLSDPFTSEIEKQSGTCDLIAYHAMLSIDKPKLFKALIKAVNIIADYCPKNMFYSPAVHEWDYYETFGADYRKGESIFYRAQHHYKQIKEIKCNYQLS